MAGMKLCAVRSFSSACIGALAVLGLIALSGCPAESAEEANLRRMREDGKMLFGRNDGRPGSARRSVPLVRLGATAVAFPAGTLTRSETVWAGLNHRPWQARTRALLTLNGVRVGMLKVSAWGQLAKTFEKLKGVRLKSAMLPVYASSPVQVFLQRNDKYQTIFTYRLDETMFGHDCPPGDAMLAVQCIVEPGAPTRMTMIAMPQVRTFRRKMRYTKTDDRYEFTQRPTLYNFEELAWRIALTTDDIVVMGPGPDAERNSSLGRMFFVRDVDGTMFETVLLLAPNVVMVGGPGGPQAPPRPKATSRPATRPAAPRLDLRAKPG